MQLRRSRGGNEYCNSALEPPDCDVELHKTDDKAQDVRSGQRHVMYHWPKRKAASSTNRQGILNMILAVALLFEILQVYKYECRLEASDRFSHYSSYAVGQISARGSYSENPEDDRVGYDEEILSGYIPHNYYENPEQNNRWIISINTATQAPFQPSKYNYSLPAMPNEYTLPDPRRTKQSTVVVILSARSHFENRSAIRESWAKGRDNVYFVIGGPTPDDMNDVNRTNPNSTTNLLFQEQRDHGDILDSIHPESYKGLPYKVHFAFRWVSKTSSTLKWILKADDDVVVRIRSLEKEVLQKYNPDIPLVLGKLKIEASPHRGGKWAEDPKFTETTYPPWAFGSAGYVVSRPIVNYIGNAQNLYYYQGEDAGLGVWLSEATDVNGTSGLGEVTFIDHPAFHQESRCSKEYVVIGHDKTPEQIKECFEKVGDEVSSHRHAVYSTMKQHMSRIDEDEDEEVATLSPMFDTVYSDRRDDTDTNWYDFLAQSIVSSAVNMAKLTRAHPKKD